jgi:hypothetical protein
MSFELIGTPRAQKVTKKMAEKWSQMEQVRNDRALSEKRVDAYKQMASKGTMRPVQWAKALCLETNETYRVNGKHTSTAFSQLETIPDYLTAIVEEYQCDTLRDVADLYGTFDTRLQLRTASDINKSFAGIDDELCDLPIKIVNLGVTGVSMWKWQNTYDRYPPTERAECLFDPDVKLFLRFLYEVIGSAKSTKRMRRGPVVWAMYASWRKSRSAAMEFWSAVRDETGESNKTPDRKLSRWLMESSVGRRSGNPEMYARCIHAWNAWRTKSQTNLTYHADKPLPAAR